MPLTRSWKVGADRLPWFRHICLPILSGQGIGTETCEVYLCVSSWWPLVYSDTNTNCAVVCNLYFDVWTILCVICIWGKGWFMVAYPLRALVVLYLMLAIFTKYEMIYVWDTICALIHLPRMFLSTDYFCEKKTDWTSFHGCLLYQIHISYWW